MQKAVGRDVMGLNGEAPEHEAGPRFQPFKPHMIGQEALLALAELGEGVDLGHANPLLGFDFKLGTKL
jgi:hypothetical protein